MKIKKITAVLLAVCMLATLALTGCGSKETPETTTAAVGGTETAGEVTGERTITVAIGSDWGSLNTYDSTNTMTSHYVAVDAIFDKLTYIASDGSIEPRAAKSWELAEDGMSATFLLNENCKWHDKESVTAGDWVWTINYMTSSYTTQHGFGKYLAGVDPETGVKTGTEPVGAEAVSDYELKLTFNAPIANLEQWIRQSTTTVVVLPEHLLGEYTDETVTTADYFNKPIGSGACVVESIEAGNNIVTTANKDYQLGCEGFDKLIIQYASGETWIPKIAAGDVDVLQNTLNPSSLQGYEDDASVVATYSDDIEGGINLVFNCLQVPTKIRQAVDRIIDKQWIIDSVYLGKGEASYSLLLPSYPYYTDGIGGRDEEGAKKLVDEAIADGVWSSSDVLNIYYNGTTSEALAKLVEADVEAIGINVELISGDTNTVNYAMFSNEDGYDAQVVNLGVAPNTPTKQMITYQEAYDNYSHSHIFRAESQPGYEADYNTWLDLFGKLSGGVDLEATAKAYQEWEYENVPQSQLSTYYTVGVTSDRIENVDSFASSYYNFATWNWTVVK